MSLHCLSAKTATLLKSSQIITSVSTVVKELVENAIDAGANNIEVKLEYHGMGKIEVKDDGCGIKREDTTFMCLPSYTSKITEFSDLDELCSYGFRGEALNAMCRLADVTVTTRTESDEYALSYTLDAKGEVKSQQPSHIPKGTVVSVSGLFRSLPVRREFLRQQQRAGEELRRAEAVVKALAVIHPQLRATFSHNKCQLWQKAAVATVRQSLLQVVGHQLIARLEEHVMQHSQFTAMLMLPKKNLPTIAEVCQSSVDCIMLYINKRPVRHKKIEKLVVRHVAEFYSAFPSGKYPTCFIAIEVPPAEMDVNVEPNKTRVFLKDEDVLLSKLDEFLNFHYEPKLPKPQVTNNHKALRSEKNQENQLVSQGNSQPKRAKLDAAEPAKCPQKNVRAAYKMLQTDSNAALQRMQQCEVDGRPADPEEVQRIVGECRQALAESSSHVTGLHGDRYHDDQVADSVDLVTEPASEHGEAANRIGDLRALPAEHLQLQMNGDQRTGPCNALPFVNGAIDEMEDVDEGTTEKSNDSIAQHLNNLAEYLNNKTATNDIPGTFECISQFFPSTVAPISNLEANNLKKNYITKVIENKSLVRSGEAVSEFLQRLEEDFNGVIEEMPSVHHSSNMRNTRSLLTVAAGNVIPEHDGANLRNLLDPVSNQALEGHTVTGSSANPETVGSAEIQVAPEPGGNATISGPDFDTERNCSVGNSGACLDGGRAAESSESDVELCGPVSQSLWEAADAAAGLSGHVVPAGDSSAGKQVLAKEHTDQSHRWNADGFKADKWSRGNVVNKEGRALKSGAVLATSSANLDETVESASSQMGCREQSAFTKFSRHMRPKILDENPGIAFTKVAGLLVSRWRALPPEEQARYEGLAAQVQHQRQLEQARRPLIPPKGRRLAKKEVLQSRNTLDAMLQHKSQQTTSAAREYVRTEMLPITVDSVLEQFCLRNKRVVGGVQQADELRLLGQLKPSGSWLYVRGQELGVLRHWGLQEKVLHHRLMAEHTIPTRQLDDKLSVSHGVLGLELWELLVSLDRKFCSQTRRTLVSIPAVDRNGFKVEVQENGDQVVCFLTGVASVTRFCGVTDLRETLQLIQVHGTQLAQLRYCRPLKIANYLRSEAVRMVQQSPSMMDHDDLLELLRFWDFHMRHEEPACLHHKPIYVPIHVLDSKLADVVCFD